MYKYLPATNMVALKRAINDLIGKNNISSNKVAKAIGVDTSHLKLLRDPSNTKLEISPEQYWNLLAFFGKKVTVDLGPEPDNYYDRFMFMLFKKGMNIDDFCSRAGRSKNQIKNYFANSGVSSQYKDIFTTVLSEEEFSRLSSFTPIILEDKRDSKLVRSINDATLVNYFMVKRGHTAKTLGQKIGFKEDQIKTVLSGFILDSTLRSISEALELPITTLDNIVLNSNDPTNNFGYFLQKQIHNQRENVFSMSQKIGMDYCSLKHIVTGSRNIRADEFEKIATALNLDIDELKAKAPKIVEGDDKFVPWNFVKWIMENPEVTLDEISKVIKKDAGSLIDRIRGGRTYILPEITTLMTITGLSKEKLRATLTAEEIESLKAAKRKAGRKYTSGIPGSFDMFIREHIEEKGLTFNEFSELVGCERTTLRNWLRANKIREDVLENILSVLDLAKADIKKFHIETFKTKASSKPKVKVKQLDDVNIDDKAKQLAKSIFTKLKETGEVTINNSSLIYRKLFNSQNFWSEVKININAILIDNGMGDWELTVGYNGSGTEISFYLNEPEPPIETIIDKDESSVYPDTMIEMDMNMVEKPDHAPEETVLEEVVSEISQDDKDFIIEQFDKFLEFFSNLKEEDQCMILRMMNLVKNPGDIKMENIPEECFLLGRFAEYKKIDTLVKLIGLDK
jgi:transcriptional regulator with XRE-family HTH domain